MSAWANSKFIPGQFTGSTGANILSARELTSGFQAWAKRVSGFFIFTLNITIWFGDFPFFFVRSNIG